MKQHINQNARPAGLQGHTTVWKVYPDGRREIVFDKKNQIVNVALEVLEDLLAQIVPGTPSPADNQLAEMKFEASATPFANPALPTDTGPVGTVSHTYSFTSSDVDQSVGGIAGLMEFRGLMDRTQGNGDTVRAAGLYTQGGRLFARQIFGAIEKTNQFALEIRWRIQFLIL